MTYLEDKDGVPLRTADDAAEGRRSCLSNFDLLSHVLSLCWRLRTIEALTWLSRSSSHNVVTTLRV